MGSKLSKESIIEHYINQKQTLRQVAGLLRCSNSYLFKVMKKLNIPTRKKIPTPDKYCCDCTKKLAKKNTTSIRCKPCAGRLYSSIYSGENSPFYDKNRSPEIGKKISLALGGTGVPYEDRNYSKEFYDLRNIIRLRDNYKCRFCDITEEKHLLTIGYELSVHHIDYNKQNNTENNLITLCGSCHSETNHNRIFYKLMLQRIIAGQFSMDFYLIRQYKLLINLVKGRL